MRLGSVQPASRTAHGCSRTAGAASQTTFTWARAIANCIQPSLPPPQTAHLLHGHHAPAPHNDNTDQDGTHSIGPPRLRTQQWMQQIAAVAIGAAAATAAASPLLLLLLPAPHAEARQLRSEGGSTCTLQAAPWQMLVTIADTHSLPAHLRRDLHDHRCCNRTQYTCHIIHVICGKDAGGRFVVLKQQLQYPPGPTRPHTPWPLRRKYSSNPLLEECRNSIA